MGNPFDQNAGDQGQDDLLNQEPEKILEELVGDGKKYATAADLAKALVHSQSHIGKLEGENADFRSKLDKASTVNDILEKMKQQGQQDGTPDNTGSDDNQGKPTGDTQNVDELVQQAIEAKFLTQRQDENFKKVVDTLAAKYGSKAHDVWDQAEKGLGVNLDELAKKSPDAVFKMLGIGSEESQPPQNFGGDKRLGEDHSSSDTPPEGSKRYVDYLLKKGEITRKRAYSMKLEYSANPEKYNS